MPPQPKPQPGSVLLFDVNETLLDVNVLKPHFQRIFADAAVLKQWFAQMLLYSQTVTQTQEYVPFGKLARAALQMVAEIHQVNLTPDDIEGVIQGIASLPPHPEVSQGLSNLKQAGFHLFALTNSQEKVAQQQISNAGLEPLFERVFSVDSVSRYKPAPQPYLYVADALSLPTSALTMIAAHPWDLIGAKAAGCEVAFLERPGTAWFPLEPKPALSGRSLTQLADQLIALRHQATSDHP